MKHLTWILALLALACGGPTDPWPACEERTIPMYEDEGTNLDRQVTVGVVNTTYCVVAVGAVP